MHVGDISQRLYVSSIPLRCESTFKQCYCSDAALLANGEIVIHTITSNAIYMSHHNMAAIWQRGVLPRNLRYIARWSGAENSTVQQCIELANGLPCAQLALQLPCEVA